MALGVKVALGRARLAGRGNSDRNARAVLRLPIISKPILEVVRAHRELSVRAIDVHGWGHRQKGAHRRNAEQ